VHQSNPTQSVKICDHLTTRPGGFRRKRTRSILHDNLAQTPSLDVSRKPDSIEALANLSLCNAAPRRNTQWLTPWP
jgi:hypothetical protein